jgi:hypothetical protein
MKRFILHLFADMLIVIAAFLIVSTIYRGPVDNVIDRYQSPFIVFVILFLIISFWFNKYENVVGSSFQKKLALYGKALFYTTGISVMAMYLLQFTYYSRTIILGTILGIGILEFLWVTIYQAFRYAILIPEKQEIEHERMIRESLLKAQSLPDIHYPITTNHRYRETIQEEAGVIISDFINKISDLDSPYTQVLSTTTRFNILNLPDKYFQTIVNLKPVNDVKYINKYFESVNVKLRDDGIFINCVETIDLRKQKLLKKYPLLINWFVCKTDTIINRVLPKLPLIKRIYFKLTNGKNRALSMAEVLGRLYSCGFELIDHSLVNERIWFRVKRKGAPAFDRQATYGPLIKLRRVGKDGEIITVYKMRTMYAYSEYIQEYVYNLYGSGDGDKIINDFRITNWGKFMRKLWIDELPMIINWINGDLKLVGIRPLSKHKFSTYPLHLQQLRIKYKPGLVPPFYADLPKTEEAFYESEERYVHIEDVRTQQISLFAAYLITVVLLMVLPLNSGEINNIFVLHLRGDYLIHAALFLPWAFFGFLLQKRTWLWMFVGFLFAVCAEGIQYFLPYRAFNVNDVLSNTIGILLSFLLLFTILKMRSGLNL